MTFDVIFLYTGNISLVMEEIYNTIVSVYVLIRVPSAYQLIVFKHFYTDLLPRAPSTFSNPNLPFSLNVLHYAKLCTSGPVRDNGQYLQSWSHVFKVYSILPLQGSIHHRTSTFLSFHIQCDCLNGKMCNGSFFPASEHPA